MILVIDYGMGNLRSVSKALEHLGGKVKISASPKDLEKAEKIILPGVGAFGDAVRELKFRKLFKPLRAALDRKTKFLGICLGLQLLFTESEEDPQTEGLGFFPGKVQGFRSKDVKIPHMGWNTVKIEKAHPLFKGLPDNSHFYFVHSYYAVPDDPGVILGRCEYGQEKFSAILGTATTFATQFHPEKSQAAGLCILKNFLKW